MSTNPPAETSGDGGAMEVELQDMNNKNGNDVEKAEAKTLKESEDGSEDNDKEKKKDIEPLEIAGPPVPERESMANGLLLTSFDSFLADWCATIIVGICVVSYWRGGWVIWDHYSCEQPSTGGMLNGESFCFLGIDTTSEIRKTTFIQSFIAGYILLLVGLSLLNMGFWKPTTLRNKEIPNQLKFHKSSMRVIITLLLGGGTVCLWRGIWYFFDYYVTPDDPLKSAKLTFGFGIALCMLLCSSASLLAPPAIFLMDGPAHLPPPIGVTIITSYRSIAFPANVAKEKTQKDPLWVVCVDLVLSYVVLPFGVVGFWRGLWALLDTWLWGFTASQQDVNMSILWSFLLGIGALLVGSEDVAQHFSPEASLSSPTAIMLANGLFGRIRTLILAFGAVNFWRAVWLFWDEYLGNTSGWSAILSHVLGIVGLLLMGCLTCITAPPSTLGVDAVAHPESADEPLFHNVPVPAEAFYFLGIARRPEAVLKQLQMAEDCILAEEGVAKPSDLKDPKLRASVSTSIRQRSQMFTPIDNLLVEDEYMYKQQARSTRFNEQTASLIQSATRSESSSVLRLSTKHYEKRMNSQFYRSR